MSLQLSELLKASPSFSVFVIKVAEKNPLQAKALTVHLNRRDATFFNRAEAFSHGMMQLLADQDMSIDYMVDAYLKMCWDMLREQTKFKKTGEYTCSCQAAALENVYRSEKEMTSYMYGLALSQFLWPNHYDMYDYFMTQCASLQGVERYLEVGPGHGLYLVEALKAFPDASSVAVDISPTSIKIAQSMVKQFSGEVGVKFINQDVAALGSGSYDYIVMCEVLEHLDDPGAILGQIRNLMSENGRLFITTCANCPAIDHVYLYRDVAHIREEITGVGFNILNDICLPVGDFPEETWRERSVEINYAAVLQKA